MQAVAGSQQLPSMNETELPTPIFVMVHAMAYTMNLDDAAFYIRLLTVSYFDNAMLQIEILSILR